jgi:NAD(P)-dependent dehydrogenase (short-subunit alcohol dehydrogenase family)
MTKKLEGKVAVITGATSGMALATAKLFVEEGAYVFITGRRQEQLDAAVKEIGKNVTGVQGDAGNLADLDRLYDAVKAKKGHIDILYASAGLGEFNIPLGAITEANFDNTFNVNVRGTLFTVQKALPLMRDGGSVIMTGSPARKVSRASASITRARRPSALSRAPGRLT